MRHALVRGSLDRAGRRALDSAAIQLKAMSMVIVGAGPNLDLAIGRPFGRGGFAVGLISRTESRLVELVAQLELDGL
jgi:hypothetical protein